MSDDLVKMARLAQHDERMSTGALYGDLADRIEELEAKLALRTGEADAKGRIIAELEEEIVRLRALVPRPDMTKDEVLWRDFKRGVTLAELAKERGVTRERMRYTLAKIERDMERLAALTRQGE